MSAGHRLVWGLRDSSPALTVTRDAFSVPFPKPLAWSLIAVWELSQKGDASFISEARRSGGDPGSESPLFSSAKMKRGQILLVSVHTTCDKCLETLVLP